VNSVALKQKEEYISTGALIMHYLSISKALMQSSAHEKVTSLCVREYSGEAMFAK